MSNNLELQRRWNEKSLAILVAIVFLFMIITEVHQGTSNFLIYLYFLYLPLAFWGVWLNFTKPDAKIVDDKIYLFKNLIGKPIVLNINEIQSIERNHLEVPVYI